MQDTYTGADILFYLFVIVTLRGRGTIIIPML